MKNMINDASVNEWFTQQMASLTPTKMILALLTGFIVGMIIAHHALHDYHAGRHVH